MNPYKLGVELYRNIEERWDKGQFGQEWEDCDDLDVKKNWDLRLGLGKQKVFEVRALYNDVTFIDEFLTPEFAMENKMFTFNWSNRNERYEIDTREFQAVKEKLLAQLTNFGNPPSSSKMRTTKNRGELLLMHEHRGVDLRNDYARETMASAGADLEATGVARDACRRQARLASLRRQRARRATRRALTPHADLSQAWPFGMARPRLGKWAQRVRRARARQRRARQRRARQRPASAAAVTPPGAQRGPARRAQPPTPLATAPGAQPETAPAAPAATAKPTQGRVSLASPPSRSTSSSRPATKLTKRTISSLPKLTTRKRESSHRKIPRRKLAWCASLWPKVTSLPTSQRQPKNAGMLASPAQGRRVP
ncbi:MAG: SpoVR family protein [Pseudomonadota bacterium]